MTSKANNLHGFAAWQDRLKPLINNEKLKAEPENWNAETFDEFRETLDKIIHPDIGSMFKKLEKEEQISFIKDLKNLAQLNLTNGEPDEQLKQLKDIYARLAERGDAFFMWEEESEPGW